jgi:threonine synthase
VLYVTTRDIHDVHTANKTLISNISSDGGLYLPRNMPQFTSDQIAQLLKKSFNDIFADILNLFFTEQSTGRDIDLFIGKNPAKTVSIGRKILVAQAWHNPERTYSYIEDNLYRKLCKGATNDVPTQWLKITARMALIISLYGQLLQDGSLHSAQSLDIAVDADDSVTAIAAFYAKQLGLPIGKLICGCDKTEALWDFIHLGECNTASAPDGLLHILERLIYEVFGSDEVENFIQTCQKRSTYHIPDEAEYDLTESVFCAVVRNTRVASVINSVYRTDDFLLDTCAARSFGAIQDYRAKTGSSNLTLLLSDNHPLKEADIIMKSTGLTQSTFLSKCRTV